MDRGDAGTVQPVSPRCATREEEEGVKTVTASVFATSRYTQNGPLSNKKTDVYLSTLITEYSPVETTLTIKNFHWKMASCKN